MSFSALSSDPPPLHVERQWLHVGHRAHSAHSSIHRSLNILQRLALGLGHAQDNKHQGYAHHSGKEPERTVRLDDIWGGES